jgi:preprotein translocase subunit SecG
MGFVIVILTALLVLNCLVLILLVLIQLPKKDAGAGMAFGGGAADALFGAGSGNALTKITKYATVIFFVLALFLGYLQDQVHSKNSASLFEKQVQQKQMETPSGQPSLPAALPPPAAGTNSLLSVPLTTPGNPPATAPTNASAAPSQSK